MEQEDENGDIKGQKGKSVTIKRNSSRLIKHCKLLSISQGVVIKGHIRPVRRKKEKMVAEVAEGSTGMIQYQQNWMKESETYDYGHMLGTTES